MVITDRDSDDDLISGYLDDGGNDEDTTTGGDFVCLVLDGDTGSNVILLKLTRPFRFDDRCFRNLLLLLLLLYYFFTYHDSVYIDVYVQFYD